MGRGWAEALMETNFEPTELLGLEEASREGLARRLFVLVGESQFFFRTYTVYDLGETPIL